MNKPTTPRLRLGRRPLALLISAGLILQLAGCSRCADKTPPPSPEQIAEQLLLHLQRIGDLSASIADSSETDGTIYILGTGNGETGCTPTQSPTKLKQPLAPEALQRVSSALDLINLTWSQNKEPRFLPYTARHKCLTQSGDSLPDLSPAEAKAQMYQELKDLAQLTAYIKAASQTTAVQIWAFGRRDQGCAPCGSTTQPANQAVDQALLGKVEQALQSFNGDLAAHQGPRFESVRPEARCE